jgi:hypothetical protein
MGTLGGAQGALPGTQDPAPCSRNPGPGPQVLDSQTLGPWIRMARWVHARHLQLRAGWHCGLPRLSELPQGGQCGPRTLKGWTSRGRAAYRPHKGPRATFGLSTQAHVRTQSLEFYLVFCLTSTWSNLRIKSRSEDRSFLSTGFASWPFSRGAEESGFGLRDTCRPSNLSVRQAC